MISIIVPVYKVEPYLDQCIQSIVDQTYSNLEIILVDDGSPDQCPQMCDAWAERDQRIKVIHKENGGLSDARNAGLAMAAGDYIGFVDSDDFIAPAMYEVLLQQMMDTDSDISAGGVTLFRDDGDHRMLTQPGMIVLENADAMEALLKETHLKQPVWYKLYKRAVVEGILFEKGKYHEDVFWSYQPIAKARRVCVSDTPLYYYRQREDSIMGSSFSEKRLDGLEGMEQRYRFICEQYPQFAAHEKAGLYGYTMYLMQKVLRSAQSEEMNAVRDRLMAYAKRYRPNFFELIKMPLNLLVWRAMACVSFIGTCKLRNRLGRGVD